MLFPDNHPSTLTDVIPIVENADMPATRRRDLVSAINRICAMSGNDPRTLRAEPAVLREAIAGIRPAAHGIKQQTFANLRSNFVAALVLGGIVESQPRGLASRDPTWAPFVARLTDLGMRNGLASFLNWCARQNVAPDEVEDATVQAFLTWLETRTVCLKPRDVVWRTPRLWNMARETVEGWPDVELAAISFKAPPRHLTWDRFDERFRRDVDAYIGMREAPDVFADDPDSPTRPLAATTLRQQREHLRLAGSVLVEHGRPVDAITSLADLVEVEAFKVILRHYYDQADHQANAFATCLATTLRQVARTFVRVPSGHRDEIKRLANRLPAIPHDLTAKNKALLRELEPDECRARLVYLPDNLLADVARDIDGPRLRFVDAQVAIVVDIALVAPLRPQNLLALDWRRHFSEPDGPRGRLIIHIPAAETKGRKRDQVHELPPDVARHIRWYRRHILPRLGADPNGRLFVTRAGEPKAQETLSEQITKVIERDVGVHMTPHEFRHFSAVSYLEDHPEDFETIRALLGHSWSKTTQIYAGQSSRRASRAYGKFVEEQRRKLKLKRSRTRKRGRRT